MSTTDILVIAFMVIVIGAIAYKIIKPTKKVKSNNVNTGGGVASFPNPNPGEPIFNDPFPGEILPTDPAKEIFVEGITENLVPDPEVAAVTVDYPLQQPAVAPTQSIDYTVHSPVLGNEEKEIKEEVKEVKEEVKEVKEAKKSKESKEPKEVKEEVKEVSKKESSKKSDEKKSEDKKVEEKKTEKKSSNKKSKNSE